MIKLSHKKRGKSSLTSLVACFILGKVYCKTYRRDYADDLKVSSQRANIQSTNN